MIVQENNLSQISKWPELTGSMVILRGVGQTKSFSRPILILQPVGRLIPYCIEHEALLTLIKQFACIVEQLSIRGYLHGDLSYYNLLQHVDSEGRHHDDQGMRALLVDMQTLMPLREVTCSLVLILQQNAAKFDISSFRCLRSMSVLLCRLLKQSSPLAPLCSWD